MKNTPPGNHSTHQDQIPHEIRNRAEYDHVVSILRADLEKTPEIAELIQGKKNDVDLVNKLRKCTFPTLGVVGQGTGKGHPQNWYTLLGRLAYFLYPKSYQASKWPIMASHLNVLLQEVISDNNVASPNGAFQYSYSREDCVVVMGHRGGRNTYHQPIADVVAIMDNQAAKVMQILIQTGELTPKKAVEILVWGDRQEKIKPLQVAFVAKLLSVPIEEVRKLLQ